MLSFLTESTREFTETPTVGGFVNEKNKNTFDDIFTEAYNQMLSNNVDIMVDVNQIIKNKGILQAYKDALLGELYNESEQMLADGDGEYGTHSHLYEQVSDMFDNCVEDFLRESTTVPQLLPIKAVDFPILIKQQLKLATKDIIQTEVTKTPIIKKHIEQTYIVDNTDKTRRWKYPQCFFTDEFLEAFDAGKGLKIKDTPVTLPAFNYDVIGNLTDAENPQREDFTMDLRIVKAIVQDTLIVGFKVTSTSSL